MSDERSARLILNAITLRGLGPYLEGARLELRPLTILCGKNGSGKSTWLKMLNLLQRSHLRGLLPLGFDHNESAFWLDETNALIEASEELPPRDERAESKYGPLGTIGLEFTAAQDIEWPSPLNPREGSTKLDSAPLEFLWRGRCRRGTDLHVRLAHPTTTSSHLSLDELVDVRLDGMYTIRMHKAPDSSRYAVHCSGAFLPDRSGDDTMIFIAEIQETGGRTFTVRQVESSVDSDLQELLCRTAVRRIGELLDSLLSGYFFIGAIRELQGAGSLADTAPGGPHQELERLLERLLELVEDRHTEDAGELAPKIKDYALRRIGFDPRPYIARRYVGSSGEATHHLERAFAYNLMRHEGEPVTGRIDQAFCAADLGWGVVVPFLEAAEGVAHPTHRRLWELFDPESRRELPDLFHRFSHDAGDRDAKTKLNTYMAEMLNRLLPRRELYQPDIWDRLKLGDEARMLLDRGIENLAEPDVARLNRLLIEAAFRGSDAMWDLQAGFLFETYVSYWLRNLVDVNIFLPDTGSSLDDVWPQGSDPPHGYLVHSERRPQPVNLKSYAPTDPEPEDLNRFGHPCFGGFYPAAPALLSAGFHQVAPIVVQAGLLQRGELLAVENPEAHLHPSLQLGLTEFLIGEADTGKYILIETHSDLVVRRVLRAILQEDVAQEDVRLYFAVLGEEPSGYHCAVLEALKVDEHGRIENWPEGFMDDSVREARRLMDAMYGPAPPPEEDD